MLADNELPEGSFIPPYDSTPYQIVSGHIAAKIPCNYDGTLEVNILIGQVANLQPAELKFISPLSYSGKLCLYHTDVESTPGITTSDIAIQNNSTDDIEFPETIIIILDIGKISKIS